MANQQELIKKIDQVLDDKEFILSTAMSRWVKTEILDDTAVTYLLTLIADGKSVATAARMAGTTAMAIYRHRAAFSEFNQAMNEALKIREAAAEDKLWELSIEGQKETVTKGDIVEERITYPTAALLQFKLKSMFPDKYGIERKEIKAGPLETPPDVIRNENDRKKLLARIEEARAARGAEPKDLVAEAVQVDTFDDLL
jgi:hypothetical protein